MTKQLEEKKQGKKKITKIIEEEKEEEETVSAATVQIQRNKYESNFYIAFVDFQRIILYALIVKKVEIQQ